MASPSTRPANHSAPPHRETAERNASRNSCGDGDTGPSSQQPCLRDADSGHFVPTMKMTTATQTSIIKEMAIGSTMRWNGEGVYRGSRLATT